VKLASLGCCRMSGKWPKSLTRR